MSPGTGTAAQLASVRQFLHDSGYTTAEVLARTGSRAMSELLTLQAGAPADDLLEMLIHLFLLGAQVDAARLLPADTLALLLELGLVEPSGGGYAATVELYPVGGLYIASDRNRGAELPPGEDKVFSAITPQTEDFLAMLPRTPCPSLLELCAGAGAAALEAAREYAVHAFAYDLSARSTRFAEFNRRLNGIGNATIARGDLYAPAGRRTFDRIVAHPPYVPTLHATELLRDGGEVGETLTRRIVAGLPAYLHPGGRLYCLALLAEQRGQTPAERIRRWLGEAGREFDVVAVARRRIDPPRVVFDNWRERNAQPGDIARWQYLLKQQRVEAFVYTAVIVERRTGEGEPLTLDRETGGGYPVAAVESLLRRSPVWDARPVAAAVERSVDSRLESGAWSAESFRYTTAEPFRAAWRGPCWVSDFLAACDGARTVRDLLPADVETGEFERVVRELASEGMVAL